MATPAAIAGYITLFALTGWLFILVSLLVGRLLRPTVPNEDKAQVYECGEPAIGTSFVQFDLRFYVVALVFIVFDVEVAFLFPLATVFGKASHLRAAQEQAAGAPADEAAAMARAARALAGELGVIDPDDRASAAAGADGAWQLAVAAFAAINVFFAVLLVGFAYEWRSGALDWVRAVTHAHRGRAPPGLTPPIAGGQEPGPGMA